MALEIKPIKYQSIKVHCELLEKMLGSLPGDKEIFKNYIATKDDNRTVEKDAEEENSIMEEYDKGVTIFAKHPDGTPFLYDYIFKGFFKSACKALREKPGSKSEGLSAYKSKIDLGVFVYPRKIDLHFPENPETKPLEIFERPLRASTPQGERTALAASETIPAGTTFDIEIRTTNYALMELVCEWFGYGEQNGLGCWRSSSAGRFRAEIIEENTFEEKPKAKRGRKKKEEETNETVKEKSE